MQIPLSKKLSIESPMEQNEMGFQENNEFFNRNIEYQMQYWHFWMEMKNVVGSMGKICARKKNVYWDFDWKSAVVELLER